MEGEGRRGAEHMGVGGKELVGWWWWCQAELALFPFELKTVKLLSLGLSPDKS